jgi:glycosyltransferase involved in cell wall biosynthesis
LETPQITVLLSVHNGERWVEKAITSILEQTFSCFEFLIIDDASHRRYGAFAGAAP